MSRRAFLIGSNGPDWAGTLKYAEADAIAVGSCFKASCGFDDVEIVPGSTDPFDLLRRLTAFVEQSQQEDTVVLYFSGHGQLGPRGRLHLLLPNTSTNLLRSLRFDVAVEPLESSVANQKLVILDCCHAGAAGGIKSPDIDAQTIADPHPSLILMLASSRLEKARELEELGGSFFSHHMCALLNGKDRSSISVLELSENLRRAAVAHNKSSAKKVPLPYVFGDVRDPLLLKNARGSAPAQVALKNLYAVEVARLAVELAPYDQWQSTNILNELPVDFDWSEAIAERLKTLRRYVDTDQWPCEVVQETKKQFRQLVEEYPTQFENTIRHGVRIICAAARQADADGTDQRPSRNMALRSFVEAKALSFVRLLLAMRLHNESAEPWMPSMYWLDITFSGAIQTGLTPLVQEDYRWTFWTDADLGLPHKRYRVYVPQRLGQGPREFGEFGRDVILRCMVPQVVDHLRGDADYNDVAYMFRWEPERFWKSVTVRGEQYISTDRHNWASHSGEAQQRAVLGVASSIRNMISSVARGDRERALVDLWGNCRYPDGITDAISDIIDEERAARLKIDSPVSRAETSSDLIAEYERIPQSERLTKIRTVAAVRCGDEDDITKLSYAAWFLDQIAQVEGDPEVLAQIALLRAHVEREIAALADEMEQANPRY